MRRALILCTVLSILVLGSGCQSKHAQGWVLLSEVDTLYSWFSEGNLAVVVVDRASEYPETLLSAALELSVRKIEVDQEAYAELRSALIHLVRVQEHNAYMEVSPEAMLMHLFAGAPALRKSRLTDTLALVSQESDPLALFERVQQVALFDLRGKLEDAPALETYLKSYFIQVDRTMKRR